jgi:3-dehydroquinate synthase
VNLDGLKNQVGFFCLPAAVFIDPGLLATLPAEHLRSGLGEVIKSALVGNDKLWRRIIKHPVNDLVALPLEHPFWQEMVTGAVSFKHSVVVKDYREQKLRKVLNFGHTIGHALESFSGMGQGRHLLHGEAVAAGMIGALWLSHLKSGLPLAAVQRIKSYLVEGFGRFPFDRSGRKEIMEIMAHDKKNSAGYRFTLLSAPGRPVTGVRCEHDEIDRALDFYLE